MTRAGTLSPATQTAVSGTGRLCGPLGITPVCQPAAPAFGGGCSPAPGTPLGSGHWALSRDTIRSACVVQGNQARQAPGTASAPSQQTWAGWRQDVEMPGSRRSWAGEQHPKPHTEAKWHQWHERNLRARASAHSDCGSCRARTNTAPGSPPALLLPAPALLPPRVPFHSALPQQGCCGCPFWSVPWLGSSAMPCSTGSTPTCSPAGCSAAPGQPQT